MACYVEVVVPQTGGRFHYHLPPELSGVLLKPGMRMEVPFGRRNVVAYFVREVEKPDVAETRAVRSVLDDKESVGPILFKLLCWISDYYHSPLGRVIKAALPKAVHRAAETPKILSLPSPQQIESLVTPAWCRRAPQQARVLEALGTAGGSLPLGAFAANLKGPIRRLLSMGLLTQTDVVPPCVPQAAPLAGVAPPAFPTDPSLFKSPVTLTLWQKNAVSEVVAALEARVFAPFLLCGVTASGKTEVYLCAIEKAVSQGRGAILLVPEIGLTPQLIARFYSRFYGQVAVLHSALAPGERYEEWRRIQRGEAKIVIGVRSAIFAPLNDVGVIIVDEEHDSSYKQEVGVQYHARDVALVRGKLSGAAVVLGSATPSFESFYNSQTGKSRYLNLPERIDARPLPAIRVVDLKGKWNHPYLTDPLLVAIEKRLTMGEQVLLFLNRRGFSPSLLCSECGYLPECTRCSVFLTFHKKKSQMICHYCGYYLPVPTACHRCRGVRLSDLGIGTEKVEEEIRRLFPKARVARMDRDTTRAKGAYQKIISSIDRGEIDILIGTQMIAKGHDFPRVTFVGVLCADLAFHHPDFRASERTFQMLVQVAGRAGRGEQPGEVIFQTFRPEQEALSAAVSQDYLKFYDMEMAHRKAALYPPFSRLLLLRVSHREDQIAAAGARSLAVHLKQASLGQGLLFLGPAPAPLSRLKGQYRHQILIKISKEEKRPMRVMEIVQRWVPAEKVHLDIQVDPQQFS